jgi:hypothetical protein
MGHHVLLLNVAFLRARQSILVNTILRLCPIFYGWTNAYAIILAFAIAEVFLSILRWCL